MKPAERKLYIYCAPLQVDLDENSGLAGSCFILRPSIILPTELMTMQGEFNFDAAAGRDGGYSRWLAGRKLSALELARRLCLPLNHDVEVWLTGGVRLRGKLRLQEEMLFIEEDSVRHLRLQVDHVSFAIREMESCVRLD
ncbi:MAG TPA: hypothetical protein VGY56_20075 [Verrucomicrobiae bacterium]|nr:hypothetical protein [Verrucomicrobiae bacterium]